MSAVVTKAESGPAILDKRSAELQHRPGRGLSLCRPTFKLWRRVRLTPAKNTAQSSRHDERSERRIVDIQLWTRMAWRNEALATGLGLEFGRSSKCHQPGGAKGATSAAVRVRAGDVGSAIRHMLLDTASRVNSA